MIVGNRAMDSPHNAATAVAREKPERRPARYSRACIVATANRPYDASSTYPRTDMSQPSRNRSSESAGSDAPAVACLPGSWIEYPRALYPLRRFSNIRASMGIDEST